MKQLLENGFSLESIYIIEGICPSLCQICVLLKHRQVWDLKKENIVMILAFILYRGWDDLGLV